jgi:Carboxypeptidase regulatory-like domain
MLTKMTRNLLCLGLAVVGATAVFGQTISSTILGTLADPGKALIPGAQLTLTERSTGESHTSQSNERGLFRFLELAPGQYSLRVTADGFKALELHDITLAASETRDLGSLILQLGALTEQVSVTAESTPVQTASSERSATIDSLQLGEVALKGRDVFGYMTLIPGVVDTTASRDLSSAFAVQGIGINGQSTGNKNVTLDGITILDAGGQNDTYVAPNLDSIGEVRVSTSAYQAEFGRQAGGAINFISKGGTKTFHGSAYWNRRHEDMNANSFFNNRQDVARPLYRYFVGGFSVGGPVTIPKVFNKQREKLFFFASQEYTRVKVPTTTGTSNVPTALERGGNFSSTVNSVGSKITIIDPLTAAPFPGNIIPTTRIDPTGLAMLNLFPMPNGYVNPAPGQLYSANLIDSDSTGYHNRRDETVRLDYLIRSNMSLFLRVSDDYDNGLTPETIGVGLAGGQVQYTPGYAFTAHLTHTLSPTMVNEFVFGLGHVNYGFYHNVPDYLRSSSLNPPTLRSAPLNYCTPSGNQSCFDTYINYLPTATYAGGQVVNPDSFNPSTTGNDEIPYKNFNDNYNLQDNFSKVIGNHNFKAGGYAEYQSKVEPNAGYNYAGSFNFGSSVNNPLDTGDGYANALLGIYQTYTEATNIKSPNVFYWLDSAYIQDNWRVSRRLTLDVGVRFEHQGTMHEDYGAFADFFPQLWNPAQAPVIYAPAIVGGKSVAINPQNGATTYSSLVGTLVPGIGSPVDGMHVDGLTGNGRFFALTPYIYPVPRIGFAWDVFGDGKMAIRGGFGVFQNLLNLGGQAGESGAAPVVFTPVVYYGYINQISQAAAAAAISPTTASVNEGNQKPAHSDEGNITIQRDIGFSTVVDIGYVYNNARDARQSLQINPIPEFAYANPANVFNNTEINANLLRTAYPGMGSITETSDSLSSLNYNALQLQAQHRLRHGLQFGAAYTFSKALGTQSWDNYHSQRAWFYGPLSNDRSQVLSINYSYNLPGPGNSFGIMKHVLDHWVLSGVTLFSTGAPAQPACSSVSAGPANSDPSLSGGGARCEEIANPNNFQHSFYSNFNTSAFALAPVETFGNIGQNILRQPSWWNWNVALQKVAAIGREGRYRISARIEAFNVFNHTEFSAIGTTYTFSGANNTNTQTGQYTATYSPRQMATTLRFEF